MSNTKKLDHEPRPAVEAAKVEAKLGTDSFSGEVETKYGKAVVTVLNPMDWEYSAIGLMRQGDLHGWAQRAMDDANFAVLDALHPTMREMHAFAESWEAGTGQSLGKLEASD